MEKYNKILTACKWCIDSPGCDGCPYHHIEDGCVQLKKDIIELFEEMKAQPDRPVQDNEALLQSHSEEIRKLYDKLSGEIHKLNNKLSEAEIAHERTQRELAEAQKELAYLRAVKATAEAFLGAKIDGQM